MLVLSRKEQQIIYIGEIKVTVVKIKGNQVRIGIEAPKRISIVRGELGRNLSCEAKSDRLTNLLNTTETSETERG